MKPREDILSLAVPVLWQAWRSNDWEAEDNPDWVEFDDEESARAWGLACLFNGVRPLYAAPTPPAAEAPRQEPVAIKPLEWQSFNINETVRIKLTDAGAAELKRRSDELRAKFPSLPEWSDPRDADGWHKMQLWTVMSRLGFMCSLGSSPQGMPFSTEIMLRLSAAAPPTYADAEAKGFERGIETAARLIDHKAREYGTRAVEFPNSRIGHLADQSASHHRDLAAAIRSLASPAPKGET